MTTECSKENKYFKEAIKAYRNQSGSTINKSEPKWDLVKSHLPLVKSIVSRMRIYFPQKIETDDIYSIGISGLINASQGFDPEKGNTFGSYACVRIRGALLDELRKLDWLTRAKRAEMKRYHQIVEALEQKLSRKATDDEIAFALNMSVRALLKLRETCQPVKQVSLDSEGGDEGQDLHEIIPDLTHIDSREAIESKEMRAMLHEGLKQLDKIPQKILILYYIKGMKLAEIADVFELTESRICQIHTQAIHDLRKYLNDAILG